MDLDQPSTITITTAHFQALEALMAANQTLHEMNQQYSTRIAGMEERLDQLNTSATPDSSTGTTAHIKRKELIKIKEPEPFNGEKRSELQGFLSHCRLMFLTNPDLYSTEQLKIFYAGSLLRGTAYNWFEPLLRRYESFHYNPLTTLPPDEFTSFSSFSDAMTRMFGDPDLKNTKTRELYELKQVTSVAIYVSEFQRISAFLGWNDEALCCQFYKGLRENVKDGILGTGPRPQTLADMMTKAQQIDIRIAERIAERKSQSTSTAPSRKPLSLAERISSSPLNLPPVAKTQSTAAPSDGTTPMELDSGRRTSTRRLTSQEKDRRLANNLCLFCGSSNHFRAQCPEKAQSDRRRAERQGQVLATYQSPPAEAEDTEEIESLTSSEKLFTQG
jgi:Retrotransposon gag protein